MTLQKGDFIEIEFTGRLKDGKVFDSNVKEELEKLHSGHGHEIEAKPFVLCLGEQMFLKSIDDFLTGKDIGEYEIELPPEKAFGIRSQKLIIKIPMKIFTEKKINPVLGEVFNFDGRIAKIISISGGRVIADFNNPLASKSVVYKLKVKRKIEDLNEKVKAMIDFLFKRDLDFEIKNEKIILRIESPMKQFAELFKDKFKKLFDRELEVEEIKEKPDEKTIKNHNNPYKH
jgi:FKBP-type peptidyl-prolyl cis-trans isomerase 2